METRDLQFFIKALASGSLSRASEELGYSVSAGSHILERLEKQLGVKLLTRSPRGIALTEAGESLIPEIHALLAQEEKLAATARRLGSELLGQLHVASITSVAAWWLPQIIDSFTNQYPGVEISISDGNYEEVESWLLSGACEVGFLSSGTRKELSLWPLKQDPLLVVLPEGHRLGGKEKIAPEELAGYPLLVPAEGLSYEAGRIIKEAKAAAPGEGKADHFERMSDYSALLMVKQGRGITIMPELLVSNSGISGIITRPLTTGEARTVCLAAPWPDQAQQKQGVTTAYPPLVRRFIEHVLSWASSPEMR